MSELEAIYVHSQSIQNIMVSNLMADSAASLLLAFSLIISMSWENNLQKLFLQNVYWIRTKLRYDDIILNIYIYIIYIY